MDNCTFKIEGNKLTITVPNLKAEGRPSSSGKRKIVAGTNGFVAIDHESGAQVSLNVTVPNK